MAAHLFLGAGDYYLSGKHPHLCMPPRGWQSSTTGGPWENNYFRNNKKRYDSGNKENAWQVRNELEKKRLKALREEYYCMYKYIYLYNEYCQRCYNSFGTQTAFFYTLLMKYASEIYFLRIKVKDAENMYCTIYASMIIIAIYNSSNSLKSLHSWEKLFQLLKIFKANCIVDANFSGCHEKSCPRWDSGLRRVSGGIVRGAGGPLRRCRDSTSSIGYSLDALLFNTPFQVEQKLVLTFEELGLGHGFLVYGVSDNTYDYNSTRQRHPLVISSTLISIILAYCQSFIVYMLFSELLTGFAKILQKPSLKGDSRSLSPHHGPCGASYNTTAPTWGHHQRNFYGTISLNLFMEYYSADFSFIALMLWYTVMWMHNSENSLAEPSHANAMIDIGGKVLISLSDVHHCSNLVQIMQHTRAHTTSSINKGNITQSGENARKIASARPSIRNANTTVPLSSGSGDDGNEHPLSKSLQIKSRCQRDDDIGGPKNKFSIVNFAKDLLGITSATEIASQCTESISSQIKEVEQPTDPLTKLNVSEYEDSLETHVTFQLSDGTPAYASKYSGEVLYGSSENSQHRMNSTEFSVIAYKGSTPIITVKPITEAREVDILPARKNAIPVSKIRRRHSSESEIQKSGGYLTPHSSKIQSRLTNSPFKKRNPEKSKM